jgi:hypothetical protein
LPDIGIDISALSRRPVMVARRPQIRRNMLLKVTFFAVNAAAGSEVLPTASYVG